MVIRFAFVVLAAAWLSACDPECSGICGCPGALEVDVVLVVTDSTGAPLAGAGVLCPGEIARTDANGRASARLSGLAGPCGFDACPSPAIDGGGDFCPARFDPASSAPQTLALTRRPVHGSWSDAAVGELSWRGLCDGETGEARPGASAGAACEDVTACAEVFCTCETASRTVHLAAACFGGRCTDGATACSEALGRDASLCP